MRRYVYGFILSLVLLPSLAEACACGCGMFEVGTGSMLPTGTGGTAWFEYDFLNQGMNWSGSHTAPEEANEDKRLKSSVFTAGMEYMFNRSWGVIATVPFIDRYHRGEDGGDFVSASHSDLGDIRLLGIYSGFSEDMSTGVTFGTKLPTGDRSFTGFDRDTDIGSGSTDLLLGAYHMGALFKDSKWSWFVNAQWDQPMLTQGDYRPGSEVNAATGVYYNIGPVMGVGNLSPLLQVIGTEHNRDSGSNSDPANTGYERVLLSPGVEFRLNRMKFYSDIELPVYQRVNGNQLVAPVFYKFIVAYDF